MNIKIIKNYKEYHEALAYFDTLVASGSSENDDLIDVLALLIENFELNNFDIGLPDPVAAIEFRMEQMGMARKDLVQYLGSQSRVSEILTRTKPLSLSMIRNLHDGLAIPYDVLMQDQKHKLDERPVQYGDFPIAAMFKEGFFGKSVKTVSDAKLHAEELIKELFESVGMTPFAERSTAHLRSAYAHLTNKRMDFLALQVWQAKVLHQTKDVWLPKCNLSEIDLGFMKEVLKLSKFQDGPKLAKEVLAQNGIHLVFQNHLPKTYLDGAAMWGIGAKNPVIGMTIRYDRLDNFWFVLMHELAHVSKHLSHADKKPYFDDVEGGDKDDREHEADNMALDALASKAEWANYMAMLTSPDSVLALAKKLSVHPAIIAGRYRKEAGDYRIFNRLIGNKEVREMVF